MKKKSDFLGSPLLSCALFLSPSPASNYSPLGPSQDSPLFRTMQASLRLPSQGLAQVRRGL